MDRIEIDSDNSKQFGSMIIDSDELVRLKSITISLSKALEFSNEARVICHAIYPNIVLYANKAFSELTLYQQHDFEGKNLRQMQGPLTNTEKITQMMHNLRFSGFGSTNVINYDKSGHPFLCSIDIQPIISENHYGEFVVSHYLGVITRTEIDTISKTKQESTYYENRFFDFSIQSKEKDEQDEAYDWVMNADSVSINVTDEDGGDIDDMLSITSIRSDKITQSIDNNSEYNSDDHSDKSDL